MKVLAAMLTLLVSTAAAAQECPMCSSADACIATYVKSASEAQKATKIAIRDWQQNLDKKASADPEAGFSEWLLHGLILRSGPPPA